MLLIPNVLVAEVAAYSIETSTPFSADFHYQVEPLSAAKTFAPSTPPGIPHRRFSGGTR